MRRPSLILLALLLLAACGQGRYVEEDEYNDPRRDNMTRGRLFGESGLILFGTNRSPRDEGGGALGVNAFLWRGALDTLSFMPLSSADPFGGVIITDWYSPPEAPDERFKVTAYILGRQLRADGVRVSVFRQVNSRGQWVDVPVTPDMATALEDKILLRARDLRVQSVQTAGR
ncbi:DUF3576 domain-containing protein [Elioraea tepidiphila]|uniref:DUF3576 domain-containing protein n=1 Tax=Elioraea tepidiphila TaxID=457934 RepID=UPI00035C3ECD|nr:DUF3576 domain-containing protein [Elioraea tepidiphila]